MPASPSVRLRASIVIVAWGKRAVTARCLESLDAALGDALGREIELVLVDNASPDDTLELFEAWSSRTRVVALPYNRQFAGGCNAGAAAASGDALVFLNNDTIVSEGALEPLVEEALSSGDMGAVGCRLLYPDGTVQHGGVGMIRTANGVVVPHHLFHHAAGDLPAARARFELDAVTAACLVMPRALFDDLGGFDEGYVNGWEDVDLCLRIRVAGHRVVYRGDVAIVHDEGRTRGEVRGGDANSTRFYSRWHDVLDDDGELVEHVFDGRFPVPRPPAPPLHGGGLVVEAHVSGIAAEAAEARALIACAERAGLDPAARDTPVALVQPLLADDEWAPAERALRRVAAPATTLGVPIGALAEPAGAYDLLRLARMPRDVPAGAIVLAASPALADELVAAGVSPDRVEWLPSPIEAGPPGPGGAGVLAILPTHDAAATDAVLEALAPLGTAVQMQVLPTFATAGLDDDVQGRLPHAELLAACSSERQFAELARAVDVVLCPDRDDRFERRALLSAASGATPVSFSGGPAAGVTMAPSALAASLEPSAVRAAVETSLEAPRARESLAAGVRETCGLDAVAPRLRALVERARAGAPV